MTEKKTFGYYAGRFIGGMLVTCAAICISAIAISLTAKFILWLL